ncbi:MAG: ABC transporter permease [Spirochaetales bacterium]|nr:ABC transporter permease [Spirochaetales bacterium]
MNRFTAELKKIAVIIANDPRSLAAGIIAPSLVLIMFSLLFGGLSPMPVGIVDNDRGSWGRRLEKEILSQISPLGDIPYFGKKETDYTKSLAEFEKGILTGVLVIPEDFSSCMEHHDKPHIVYHLNNFNTDFAKNMRLYLEEGIYSFYRKYYRDIDIEIEERFAAQAQVEWVDIIAVGTLLLAFAIGGMFNYLYVFFKEKLYGTLLLYRVAPRSPLLSFSARIIAAFLSSLLAGLFNALLACLLLNLNLFAYLPHMGTAVFLTVITYISWAVLLSLFMDNFYGAVMAAMGGAMILWFFSGGFTMAVPEQPVLLFIYRIIPNSYALDVMRGIVFGSNAADGTLDYIVLTGTAAVSFSFAVWAFRSRVWKRPAA